MTTKQKPATLGAGVIATKGAAKPVVSAPEEVKVKAEDVAPAKKTSSKTEAVTSINDGKTAITVRLAPEKYRALKMHGIETRMTNQDIMTAALDEYLKKHS